MINKRIHIVVTESNSTGSFWDVVVLTTFDEGQKESMLTQLNKFKEVGRIPAVSN